MLESFLIKETSTQVFSCGIYEIFKNTCIEERLGMTTSEACSFTLTDDCDTLLAQIGTYALGFVL